MFQNLNFCHKRVYQNWAGEDILIVFWRVVRYRAE